MKRNNRLTALAALVLGLVSSCKAADCSHESGDQQCGYADVSPRRVSLLGDLTLSLVIDDPMLTAAIADGPMLTLSAASGPQVMLPSSILVSQGDNGVSGMQYALQLRTEHVLSLLGEQQRQAIALTLQVSAGGRSVSLPPVTISGITLSQPKAILNTPQTTTWASIRPADPSPQVVTLGNDDNAPGSPNAKVYAHLLQPDVNLAKFTELAAPAPRIDLGKICRGASGSNGLLATCIDTTGTVSSVLKLNDQPQFRQLEQSVTYPATSVLDPKNPVIPPPDSAAAWLASQLLVTVDSKGTATAWDTSDLTLLPTWKYDVSPFDALATADLNGDGFGDALFITHMATSNAPVVLVFLGQKRTKNGASPLAEIPDPALGQLLSRRLASVHLSVSTCRGLWIDDFVGSGIPQLALLTVSNSSADSQLTIVHRPADVESMGALIFPLNSPAPPGSLLSAELTAYRQRGMLLMVTGNTNRNRPDVSNANAFIAQLQEN